MLTVNRAHVVAEEAAGEATESRIPTGGTPVGCGTGRPPHSSGLSLHCASLSERWWSGGRFGRPWNY
jgi:hypothetical protein